MPWMLAHSACNHLMASTQQQLRICLRHRRRRRTGKSGSFLLLLRTLHEELHADGELLGLLELLENEGKPAPVELHDDDVLEVGLAPCCHARHAGVEVVAHLHDAADLADTLQRELDEVAVSCIHLQRREVVHQLAVHRGVLLGRLELREADTSVEVKREAAVQVEQPLPLVLVRDDAGRVGRGHRVGTAARGVWVLRHGRERQLVPEISLPWGGGHNRRIRTAAGLARRGPGAGRPWRWGNAADVVLVHEQVVSQWPAVPRVGAEVDVRFAPGVVHVTVRAAATFERCPK
mmetsp:Transcript_100891/g.285952  ORF Transcript_100891/g.285952 Transcript_100891/m.285952 type:complete len:291 (+) Transcript_100891:65-937(+)